MFYVCRNVVIINMKLYCWEIGPVDNEKWDGHSIILLPPAPYFSDQVNQSAQQNEISQSPSEYRIEMR